MHKHYIEPRPRWREKIAACGLQTKLSSDCIIWNESICYEISRDEAELFYKHTNTLYRTMTEVTDHLIECDHLSPLNLSPRAVATIARSWEASDYLPTLFTRFDYTWDGCHNPRLVGIESEFPELLLESALAQWRWIAETMPWATQFNTIEERLSGCWREYQCVGRRIHFGITSESTEHFLTADYLRAVAFDTGVQADVICYDQISYLPQTDIFVDKQNNPIEILIGLSPISSIAGHELIDLFEHPSLCLVEPIWKKIWQTPEWIEYFRQKTGIYLCNSPLLTHNDATTPTTFYSVWVIGGTVSGLAIRERNCLEASKQISFIPHLLA